MAKKKACGLLKTINDVTRTVSSVSRTANNVKRNVGMDNIKKLSSLLSRKQNNQIDEDDDNRIDENIDENSWECQCGATSTTKFCGECGNKKT